MGLNPGGSTYGANVPPATPSSGGSSPSAGASASTSPSVTAQAMPTASGATNAESVNAQATPSEGSGGSASVAPGSGMDFTMPSAMGAEGSNSVDTASMPSQGSGNNFTENTLAPQSVSANSSPNNSDLSTYSLPQLEAKQKEFEEQVRKYSAKRDYHYASARSALVSGSKTLFNYMAFFNNRGYF